MDNYTSNLFMTQSAHWSPLIGTYKEVFILLSRKELQFFYFLFFKKNDKETVCICYFFKCFYSS